ncbi:MAG TPA: lipopolysaccharide heptosyltransferase family protein [Bacteroidetes bacterium]|nr:glycosyltransferase family 9 [bacterium BMS3Bbin04]HDO65263.1 lipopolysaccharide heptosyltransferase family protein [Bacteroidota bacterium]HEX04388.1 lipopolysaccharide heptosyltransferase family protein [Bacteroidota bacterium]
MTPSWLTDSNSPGSELTSPTIGDTLPETPAELYSPEAHFANKGFVSGIRRAWINLSHLRRPLPLLPARDQVDRIVVVHPGPMRDLVFAEPAIRALRLRFPNVDRVLYAPEEAASLYAGSGWGEVRPLEKLGEERQKSEQTCMIVDLTFRAEYEIAKQIQRTRFSHRVGVNLGGRGAFYNIPAQPPLFTDHMADFYLQLVELIGVASLGRVPSLPHGLDRMERGRRFWHEKEIQQPVVLIPGWDGQSIGWPADVFINMGRNLSEHELVVISLPSEKTQVEPVVDALNCQWIKMSSTQTLMDAIATSALVIGNDGGTLHLAAAMNRPTLMLTVNPHPWRSWPLVTANSAVFRGQDVDSARVRFDRIPVSDLAAAALRLIDLKSEKII